MNMPAQQQANELQPVELTGSLSAAEAFVGHLAALGVEQSFGVSGGAIALLYDAMAESSIELHHFRHETGAAFAAVEAHFASGKPSLVFTTTGPGLLNALNGLAAARWDGAKVIVVSGSTSAAQRGRWATQESSSYTLPQDGFYTSGPIFDFATRVEHVAELPEVLRRLEMGLERPGRFVAHISLPMSLQSHPVQLSRRPRASMAPPAAHPEDVAHVARLLREEPFAIWVGFGARKAARQVRELVERSGATCFCSPRAKGVVSENHPQFLGVTGLGGHEVVTDFMVQQKPRWVLVLGTRLGEATSFWDADMLPSEGLIHVDLDPEVPGTAFPQAHSLGIQAEIGQFLETLLPYFEGETKPASSKVIPLPTLRQEASAKRFEGPSAHPGRPVRPRVLMEAIQRRIIQGSDALLMAECGNSFAWCNHYLRFPQPERYRVSPHWGSMGHCAAGVVGAALARHGKAVAVVGDGSMLMNSEISTAAQYRAQAVWIVLNDAGYGMCRKGQETLGLSTDETDFPSVDFVGLAGAMGARGVVVESEEDLESALEQAMTADGPFVVDVRIDPDEASPLVQRFENLITQGSSKTVAGWEQ